MEQQEKKKWTEPILTVLTRATPEEFVLCGCKYPNTDEYKDKIHTGPKKGDCYNQSPDCQTKGQS